ncbi:MAG: helix-turn-helix domain-containing protein [Pseudonocardiaceae bacterium]
MEEETAPAGAVGHRVALQRKLAGLTQQQLASRSHVSASLISQVERGVVPASPAFTAAVARALRVDVETLTGQPYGPALTEPKADHAGVPALRTALGRVDDPELSGPPMAPAAWALLDDAYELAQAVAYRFGYFDLAALAVDRSREAAAHSGDSLRAAAAAFRGTHLRLHRGECASVLRVIDRGHALIEGERSPAAHAVKAQLHLRQAIAEARLGAPDRADEHIAEARRLVATGVPARPYYNVNATEANVDIPLGRGICRALRRHHRRRPGRTGTDPRPCRALPHRPSLDRRRPGMDPARRPDPGARRPQPSPSGHPSADSLPPSGPRDGSPARRDRPTRHRLPRGVRPLGRHHALSAPSSRQRRARAVAQPGGVVTSARRTAPTASLSVANRLM